MIGLSPKLDCTGCAACYAACQCGALTMRPDVEGFLRPVVEKSLCVACGACVRACPVVSARRMPHTAKICYALRTRDEVLRAKSSSGGVFGELASDILTQGGVVFGCELGTDFRARHVAVSTRDGLDRLHGSKYLPSETGEAFREVRDVILSGRKTLFCGTPCQVSGLNQFLGGSFENLLTVEVICHGVPAPAVFALFRKRLEAKSGLPLKLFVFKDKRKSWGAYHVSWRFENGAEVSQIAGKNDFLMAFSSNVCLRPSCSRCRAKNAKSGADLTICDFWGVSKVAPDLHDDKGVSGVLVHTDAGASAVKTILPRCDWLIVTEKDIVDHNRLYAQSANVNERARAYFMSHIGSGEMEAVRKRAVDGPKPLAFVRAIQGRFVRLLKHLV